MLRLRIGIFAELCVFCFCAAIFHAGSFSNKMASPLHVTERQTSRHIKFLQKLVVQLHNKSERLVSESLRRPRLIPNKAVPIFGGDNGVQGTSLAAAAEAMKPMNVYFVEVSTSI